jgi:hypothetical protein
MKTLLLALGLAGVALVTGCTTISSRISGHQAAFDSWPAAVRTQIQAGQVALGFTPEMVQVALGEPDRVTARTTAAGTTEVWIYLPHGPYISLGLGGGAVHGSTAFGGGVTVAGAPGAGDGSLRVIFDGGKVSALEARK